MRALTAVMLLATAAAGTLVVLSREPRRQLFAMAAFGGVLAALFEVLQAPDVALSELVVGTAVTPLLFLVALTAIALDRRRR
jgi:uncharacterized MnhB-related membrane protein